MELLRFRICAWVCRTNAPGPVLAVEAAFGRPKAFPFRGRPIPPVRGKWLKAKRGRGAGRQARRMREKVLVMRADRFNRRGAQCAPAGRSGTGPYEKNGAFPVFCRGGTLGRPELGRESVRSLCKDIRLSGDSVGAGPRPARRPTEPKLSPTRTKAHSKRGVPGVR